MYKLKKKSVMLAAALVLSLFLSPLTQVTARAALHPDEAEANALKGLGIILGTGSGFALDRAPTRLEAAVVLVRLLGKEETALSQNVGHPFTDVPNWADPYIGYLYSAGLAEGTSATTYGTYAVTADQMMTFLLRVLGYDDSKPKPDFQWNTAMEDAVRFSAITPACYDLVTKFHTSYTRQDMVSCIFEVLQAVHVADDNTLIKKLMDEGAFTAESVRATGIVDLLRAAEWPNMEPYEVIPYTTATWQYRVEITPRAGGGRLSFRVVLPLTYFNRQKVLGYSFSLPPDRFYWDEGNLYASYDNKIFTEKTVLQIEAEMMIYFYDLSDAQANSFPLRLTDDEKAFYTAETQFYQISNPAIQRNARKASGQTTLELAKDLCRVVSGLLTVQDIDDIDTALDVLNRGYGDCWDFSVLYTALCRARGIPARVVIVKTTFDDINVNHAIAEIFVDNLGWVPVDPLSIATKGATFERIRHGDYAYFTSKARSDFLNGLHYAFLDFKNCALQYSSQIIYQ
jgi:hypothetical protein